MYKTMEQLTAAHTGKVLQELRNLIINFEQNGREIGAGMREFLEYMDGLDLHQRQLDQEQKRAQAEYVKKARKCKKCKAVMYCYPVNSEEGDQVGGNWKSVWICGNTDCLNEEYSLNDVETENRRTDDRGQTSDDGRQMTDDRGQRTEDK